MEKEIFYDKLPVSEPFPIEVPNKQVQVAPIVVPIALTPYMDKSKVSTIGAVAVDPYEDELSTPMLVPSESKTLTQHEKKKIAKKAVNKNRVWAFFMLLISLAAIAPFVLGAVGVPIKSIKFMNLVEMFKGFTPKGIKGYIYPLLLSVGIAVMIMQSLTSLIGLFNAKDRSYVKYAVIAILFIVGAVGYNMYVNKISFGALKSAYDLMIIGGALWVNLIISIINSVNTPKNYGY